MPGLTRFARLFILLTILLLLTTLYFLYPSSSRPLSTPFPPTHFEAGGIDSPHFASPLEPDFEDEVRAWSGGRPPDVSLAPAIKGQGLIVEEDLLHGEVIMPKMENETAKWVPERSWSSHAEPSLEGRRGDFCT